VPARVGASYWNSSLLREEYPGLLARGFRALGRHGIGFFSVFIWGPRVTVTTRSCKVRKTVHRERPDRSIVNS